MALLEEGVATPFGTGFVRVSETPNLPRVVRRVVDPTQLKLAQEDQNVDGVIRIDLVFDREVVPEDSVWITAGFPGQGEPDCDQSSVSLDFALEDGAVSLSIHDRGGLQHWRRIEGRWDSASYPPFDRSRELTSGLWRAPAGAIFPVAFAWSRWPPGSPQDNKISDSVYACAECAILTMD